MDRTEGEGTTGMQVVPSRPDSASPMPSGRNAMRLLVAATPVAVITGGQEDKHRHPGDADPGALPNEYSIERVHAFRGRIGCAMGEGATPGEVGHALVSPLSSARAEVT